MARSKAIAAIFSDGRMTSNLMPRNPIRHFRWKLIDQPVDHRHVSGASGPARRSSWLSLFPRSAPLMLQQHRCSPTSQVLWTHLNSGGCSYQLSRRRRLLTVPLARFIVFIHTREWQRCCTADLRRCLGLNRGIYKFGKNTTPMITAIRPANPPMDMTVVTLRSP